MTQAGDISLSRWLKKREFLAVYLISNRCSTSDCNLGEIIDLLTKSLCMSKKTAFNVVKRLIKLRLLERKDKIHFRAKSIDDILNSYLNTYVSTRCSKLKRLTHHAVLSERNTSSTCRARD